MTETTEEIDRELEAAQHWAETRAAQLRASACDFLLAQIQRDIAFRLQIVTGLRRPSCVED